MKTLHVIWLPITIQLYSSPGVVTFSVTTNFIKIFFDILPEELQWIAQHKLVFYIISEISLKGKFLQGSINGQSFDLLPM